MSVIMIDKYLVVDTSEDVEMRFKMPGSAGSDGKLLNDFGRYFSSLLVAEISSALKTP
jgi:hypothetical protein